MFKNYVRLISFVKPHSKTLGAATLCMMVSTVFKNSPITMLVPIIDRVIANQPIVVPNPDRIPAFILDFLYRINQMPRLPLLNIIIAIGIVFTVFQAVSQFWQTYFMSDVSHRVIRDLRKALYDRIVTLSPRFFGKSRAGELVSRITYDTGVVRDAIAEGLMDALIQPMELVVNVVILLSIRWMFGIPWSLVLVIIVVMPLIIYPVVRIGKLLKKISRQSQDSMADLTSSLFETMSGIRVVQAFGMEDHEKERFGRINEHYYATMMRHVGRTLLVHPATGLVMVVCGSVIAWMGVYRIVENRMSPGAFVAFAVALFSLFRPFKRLSRLYAINQTAMAAGDRIFAVLDEKSDIQEEASPIYLQKIKKSIEYKSIDFSYDGSHPVLKDIRFQVNAGEAVAIVGPSGSGKTSLVNLLARFYDPDRGEILIDGQPIRKAAITSLRNQIGIVTQETILFNDSIAANIAYGRSQTDQAAIEEAAKIANAHDFIRKLPNGYQTRIGDRGLKLSGGERQRVAIARAVLKNPPILILDEATSALDTESERLVQDAIHRLMQGRTVLVIAHRLSTIRDCHRILVLKDGRLADQGTHEELMSRSEGLYKRLYEAQFQA